MIRSLLTLMIILWSLPAAPQWIYVNPTPTPEGIAAACFLQSGTGYAVCYSGTVLRSSDGGQGWEILCNAGARELYCTDVAFPSGETGLIAAADGMILRTANGGRSWDTIPSPTGAHLLAIHMCSAQTGYISGASGTLLKTTDGGNSWQQLPSGVNYDLFDCFFLNPDTGFVAANQRLMKTVNGGISWSEVLIPPQGTNVLKLAFFDPLTGLAIGRKGSLFRTVDGGDSWIPVASGTLSNLNGLVCFSSGTALIAAGSGLILRSTDKGISWAGSPTGFQYDFNGIAAGQGADGVVFGPFGAVWHTADNGRQWKPVNYITLDPLFTVCAMSDGNAIAAGASGLVVKTTDGGSSWKIIPAGIQQNINALLMVDPSIGYLAGDQGLLMKTIDGGSTWSKTGVIPAVNLRSLAFRDPATGLASGIDPVIYRTTNGGSTWTGIQTGTNAAINALAMTGSKAFACGSQATLLKSENAGQSWSEIDLPGLLEANLTCISTPDENHCYVAGNQNILDSWVIFFAATADGGENWSVRTYTFYPDKIASAMVFTSSLTGYLSGSDFLWKTTDGGITWFDQLPRMAPLGPNAVSFTGDQLGYAAGYSGQIMKTVNGGGIGVEDPRAAVSEALSQNFPNPFSDQTTILYDVSSPGRARIEVMDVRGVVRFTLVDRFHRPGRYAITVDAGHLEPGFWFYRLMCDGTVRVKKMIVTKR